MSAAAVGLPLRLRNEILIHAVVGAVHVGSHLAGAHIVLALRHRRHLLGERAARGVPPRSWIASLTRPRRQAECAICERGACVPQEGTKYLQIANPVDADVRS